VAVVVGGKGEGGGGLVLVLLVLLVLPPTKPSPDAPHFFSNKA
jgi:hypothetical protein